MDQKLRVFAQFSEPRILFLVHTSGGLQGPETPVTGEPTPLASAGTCTHVAYTYTDAHTNLQIKIIK